MCDPKGASHADVFVSTCIVGFEAACLERLNGHPALAMVTADQRVGTVPCCLPLDLAGQDWVALAPAPQASTHRPDVTQYARAYGSAISQALANGCGVVRLVPPQDEALALACLIEALDRHAMLGATAQLDLSAFATARQTAAQRIAQAKSFARTITEATPDIAVAQQVDRVVDAFQGRGVRLTRFGPEDIAARYPLCAAVARATWSDPARRPEVLRIEIGSPRARRAVFMAGKGVVMDTGGIDLKPAGQFGMSRDKGGAGVVAGFLSMAAEAPPDDLFICAELGFSWNGIGASALTPDHVLTSAAGLRVQVGNTDAEGRLILADLTHSLLQRRGDCSAARADFLALATLTGHSGRAFGARSVLIGDDQWQHTQSDWALLQQCEKMGDRAAVSPLRPEDWSVSAPNGIGQDLIGGTKANSIATPRGHQYPAAVIKTAGGWFASERPVQDGFLLADIAGANTRHDLPGARAAAPLLGGLAAHYLLTETGPT